jgi:hypothetical protein
VRDSDDVLTIAEASTGRRVNRPPDEASPKSSNRITVLAGSAVNRSVVMPVCGVSLHRVNRTNEGSILSVSRSLPDLERRPNKGCELVRKKILIDDEEEEDGTVISMSKR